MVTDESVVRILPGAKFRDNYGEYFGGAFNSYKSNVYVDGAEFTRCAAGDSGGGIFVEVTDEVVIKNSTFTDNSAGQEGGAVSAMTVDIKVTSSRFVGNAAKWGGGALAIKDDSNGTVAGSVFLNNSADAVGGAIYYWKGTGPLFATDCTFRFNSARQFGGALSMQDSDMVVSKCKFIANSAEMSGGVSRNRCAD